MQNPLLPLFKIESMSSLEIAELTGSRHSNVRISIERLMERGVIERSALQTFKNINNVAVEGYAIAKRDTYVAVAQLSPEFLGRLVDRWQYLEDQLAVIKFREGDKKHQLDAMEALSHLLPEDLKGEALSYIKANGVVNKATSNLFGFPKMIKKADMSPDMLTVREKIMDDYLKLYEVIEDNHKIAELLYHKYQPLRLEAA